MIKADKWLLERVFEPLACEIESWSGFNHWRVSRFMILLWIIADAKWAMNKHESMGYAIYGVELMCAAMMVALSFVYERMQRRTSTANWLKHDAMQGCARLFQALLAGLSVILVANVGTVGSIALACAWYFTSCDRLPPKERRVFQPLATPNV